MRLGARGALLAGLPVEVVAPGHGRLGTADDLKAALAAKAPGD